MSENTGISSANEIDHTVSQSQRDAARAVLLAYDGDLGLSTLPDPVLQDALEAAELGNYARRHLTATHQAHQDNLARMLSHIAYGAAGKTAANKVIAEGPLAVVAALDSRLTMFRDLERGVMKRLEADPEGSDDPLDRVYAVADKLDEARRENEALQEQNDSIVNSKEMMREQLKSAMELLYLAAAGRISMDEVGPGSRRWNELFVLLQENINNEGYFTYV